MIVREVLKKKNCLSRHKVLGLPGESSNNILLNFTDAAYKPKDGNSSFNYIMMLNSSFGCTSLYKHSLGSETPFL